MKIYIASKLSNCAQVLLLESVLRLREHEITFSWASEHAAELRNPPPVPVPHGRDIADRCLRGVSLAELLILWPAGNSRGAHIEYGAALNANKKILLLEPDDENMISFYKIVERVRTTKELLEHPLCQKVR